MARAFKAFYLHLLQASKKKMVALTAVMRKLIVLLKHNDFQLQGAHSARVAQASV